MATVNESRRMLVQYEEFCQDPRCVFDELVTKLELSEKDCSYCGPEQFRTTRNADVPYSGLIEQAFSKFAEQ